MWTVYPSKFFIDFLPDYKYKIYTPFLLEDEIV